MSGAENAVVETTPAVVAPVAQEAPKAGPVEIFVAGQEVPTPEAVVEQKQEAKSAGSEEPSDDPKDQGNRDEKGRFKGGVQDRIDELTKARREAERESEYWKARATAGDKQQDAARVAPQAPTADQFATPEEYQEALVDFKVEQKLSSKMAEKEAQSKGMAEATTKAQSWDAKLTAARAEIEGFDEAMNSNEAPVAAHVADLIMEHDHGAKVAHFFTQNPEALEKVNGMSPTKAAFEIAKIATKFDAPPASKPAGKTVSSAPAPVTPIGSGRATEESIENLSMDDYIARRKGQGANWSR